MKSIFIFYARINIYIYRRVLKDQYKFERNFKRKYLKSKKKINFLFLFFCISIVSLFEYFLWSAGTRLRRLIFTINHF